MPIKLLLADQSELALIGLRSIFSAVPRVELVGEARDPIQLSALLVRVKPDVVLIDHTAKGFGPDAIREGIHRSKRTRFVAITHNPSKMALMNALRGGVHSYIKKDCGVQEIIDAVLQTADDQRFFCGQIIEAIERSDLDLTKVSDRSLNCDPVVITKREAEIIGLIAEGGSYTKIAGHLHVRAHTLKTHRKKIMQKLGVNSTAGLVLYAVKNGLVSPNHFLFNA